MFFDYWIVDLVAAGLFFDCRKYDLYVNNDNFNSQENLSSKNGPKSFLLWLRDEMIEAKETKSILWRLVKGPLFKAQSYNKYQSNGFDFSSHDYEEGFVTQNSGVSMKAITRHRAKSTDRSLVEAKITYYGVIKQIIKLDYMELRKLFVTVIGSELKIRVMDANLIQSQAQ
ncbi:uncharacterized protein LOC113301441 [Papaver somniferum]|uniref:uncharacterized protein LOC113301441 n=1 Tax=Papaver somniferum TaxID=3469 RepID=UPI000E703853|nr:uncharacterized protein LOC113301441 [Papaver somniferum]